MNGNVIGQPIEANIWQMKLEDQIEYLKSIAVAGCNLEEPMTNMVLVAVELEHECELRCFRIVALHQNALCIELFAENRRCKVRVK